MLVRVGDLPAEPLDAAARFYAEVLPRVEAALAASPLPFTFGGLRLRGGAGGGECQDSSALPDTPHPNPSPQGEGLSGLILVFSPADHTHRAWRLAAVQELARKYAPKRINAVAADDEAAIAAAERYLDGAPGITGQYLPLDGNGAQ